MKTQLTSLLVSLLFLGCGDDTTTIFYDNGQKNWEWTIIDGKKQGTATEWYEDGQKQSEVNWINDEKQGTETWWHEDGQKKSEVNWIDGKKDGTEIWWHENGQKQSEVNWIDGRNQGTETEWWPNGDKKAVSNYNNGELHGDVIYWEKDGTVGFTEKYVNGTKVDPEEDDLIGKWRWKLPIGDATIKIFQANGRFKMRQNFADGSERNISLRKNGKRFYPSGSGDYYEIDASENLQIKDNLGVAATATKIY